MPRDPLLRRAALVLAVLLAGVACQGGEVSAPSGDLAHLVASSSRTGRHGAEKRVERGQAAANSPQPKPVSCKDRNVAVSSGRFGPAGGTLIFGESRLVIPGGALHDTVTITATTLDDETSTVNFRPEGLHFYKPAGLVLSGRGCTLPSDDAPSIVYLADDGAILETIPAFYDPHWKTVAAPITHFSGYAIAF